ncbi:Eukaryotic translation initiation factor isoform 4E [Diplonema papillatum]|nr:Eukaryotic translation initiation factor isoform 4E [Diplonema papillatum]
MSSQLFDTSVVYANQQSRHLYRNGGECLDAHWAFTTTAQTPRGPVRREIGSFDTINMFWKFVDSLGDLSRNVGQPNAPRLELFRAPYEPSESAPDNAGGGKLTLRNRYGNMDVAKVWHTLTVAMVGSQLDSCQNMVGATVAVGDAGAVDVWITRASEKVLYSLKHQLGQIVSMTEGSDAWVDYIPHPWTQSPYRPAATITPVSAYNPIPNPPAYSTTAHPQQQVGEQQPVGNNRRPVRPLGHRKSRSAPQTVSQSFINDALAEHETRYGQQQQQQQQQPLHPVPHHVHPLPPPQPIQPVPLFSAPASQPQHLMCSPHGQNMRYAAKTDFHINTYIPRASLATAIESQVDTTAPPPSRSKEQTPPPFAFNGSIYPAGLSRKQRRSIQFSGMQGHNDITAPEGIFVGGVPDGPLTEEEYAQLAEQGKKAAAQPQSAGDDTASDDSYGAGFERAPVRSASCSSLSELSSRPEGVSLLKRCLSLPAFTSLPLCEEPTAVRAVCDLRLPSSSPVGLACDTYTSWADDSDYDL